MSWEGGRFGRPSLPTVLERAPPPRGDLWRHESALHRLPSVLAARDGLFRWGQPPRLPWLRRPNPLPGRLSRALPVGFRDDEPGRTGHRL